MYLELADLDAAEYSGNHTGSWTRGLLIHRHIADGELAFFTTGRPTGTAIETLVRVEGHRWAIEDSFETAKNELGIDQNETSSVRMAPACRVGHARFCHAGNHPPLSNLSDTPKSAAMGTADDMAATPPSETHQRPKIDTYTAPTPPLAPPRPPH